LEGADTLGASALTLATSSVCFGFSSTLGAFGAAATGAACYEESIMKKGLPTTTVSPSFAKRSIISPDSGLRISTLTLSVSIIAITSSSWTKSPFS
jgi:hypothetical protein